MLHKLHGDESLRRIRLREKRKAKIANGITLFMMLFLTMVMFVNTIALAAQCLVPVDESADTGTDLSVKTKATAEYRRMPHINTVIQHVVQVEEVTDIDNSSYEVDDELEDEEIIETESLSSDEDEYVEDEVQEVVSINSRSSILSQYGWVQYDDAGNHNDMTDDLVVYTYDLCMQYNINPSLVFGMIMVESRGYTADTNSSSGAAGLGQFLASTGKLVYEDFLGYGAGTYDHSTTPHDPYIGVTMMVTYLDYLYRRHGDTMTVLESYSGNKTYAGTLKYYNNVVSWAGEDIE